MTKSLFITATGTDIGKTYIAALIIKKLKESGYNAGYYKAAASGAQMVNGRLIPDDARFVCQVAGLETNPNDMVSYVYTTSVAPHLAAAMEGNPVEMYKIKSDYAKAARRRDFLIVEGSGGIVCPLRCDVKQTIFLTDVIQTLKLDMLVVASAGLGTINSTILTLEYARQRQIKVHGIVLNRFEPGNLLHRDNLRQIEMIGNVPVVARVAPKATDLEIDVAQLTNMFQET